MKNKHLFLIAVAFLLCGNAIAADKWTDHIKFYGFVRTYFAFDTRESHAGSDDFFYYLPKDIKTGTDGVDLMEYPSFRFAALTSRLGLDVKGFTFNGYQLGGKIEADFNAGLTGNTGTAQFRLRQAYASIAKEGRIWKIGQAWHPMAADLPDIFTLESGSPFGPFNRSPQVNFEWMTRTSDEWKMGLTAAAIWQMQYVSVGPEGSSANYIKYGCTPEFYLGYNLVGENSLVRVGADVLSIKPRKDDGLKKVSDRLTTFNAFVFAKEKIGDLTLKTKLTYAQDGSHLNMVGGYGIYGYENGNQYYTPTQTLSIWVSAAYKIGNWQPQLFIGHIENMGTIEPVVSTPLATTFWGKNQVDALNYATRIQPEVIYNLGKLQLGIEYMMTLAEYGKSNEYKVADTNLHVVANHRIQAMVKFNF